MITEFCRRGCGAIPGAASGEVAQMAVKNAGV